MHMHHKKIAPFLGIFLVLILAPFLLAAGTPGKKKKVGLCIAATGPHINFVEPLIKSARNNFLKEHRVTYFVFTDGPIPLGNDIMRIHQKQLGWPYDTLMRFEFYSQAKQFLQEMDYIFAIDADTLIVSKVGSRILSDLVAAQHWGYIDKRGPYEANPRSLAYVGPSEGKYYFCSGFWGGSRSEFLKACSLMSNRIHADLKRKVVPLWHDESHLNRYLIDHSPTKILSASYCYPESGNIPYKKRIVAFDKDRRLNQKTT